MKISFHGAARTVTGSKHIITFSGGKKILLDCGMFQGMGDQTDSMNREWGFDPEHHPGNSIIAISYQVQFVEIDNSICNIVVQEIS